MLIRYMDFDGAESNNGLPNLGYATNDLNLWHGANRQHVKVISIELRDDAILTCHACESLR